MREITWTDQKIFLNRIREFSRTDQRNFLNFSYPTWTFDCPNLAWTNSGKVPEMSGILPEFF